MKGHVMQEAQVTPLVPAEQKCVAANEEQLGLNDLLQEYWHIAHCWSDPALAVRDNMTVETSIRALRKIRDRAFLEVGGSKLSEMAAVLLQDIVDNQEDNPEVEAAED